MEGLDYDAFGFVGHMPKLNTAHPEVKQYLLDVATYWIREFDIDGWRLDVANEVDHQFWKAFHTACVQEKEDIYILGEIWHSSQSWLEGDEFHAIMNYVFTEKIEGYFLKGIFTPSEMIYGMEQQRMLYRKQTNEVQFNLLDSHDTPRLLTKAHNNKKLVQSILAFMFTQTGTPCIYYGTEIGIDGFDDPDCRKCMIWDEKDQDLEMLHFMKRLIAFRKAYNQILSVGDTIWHDVRDEEHLIVFKRVLDSQKLFFYFNQNKNAATIELPENSKEVFTHLANKERKNVLLEQHGFIIYTL